MMDLRGRSIRTNKFEEVNSFEYQSGDVIEIRTDGQDVFSTKEELQINFFDLPPVMREGDIVYIGET